jgi:hypothetical protein
MSSKGFSLENILQALGGMGGLAMTRSPTPATAVVGTAMQLPEMIYNEATKAPARDPTTGLDL